MRFGVIYKNTPYKIFQYFSQPDDSLALKKYEVKKTVVAQSEEMAIGSKISIKEYVSTAIPFDDPKTSFHRSGIITFKNKKGERLAEEKPDVRSIPFEKIDGIVRLNLIYPTTPYSYPFVAQSNKRKIYNLIDISKLQYLPFMIHVYLAAKDFGAEEVLIKKRIDFIAFKDVTTLKNKGLNIFTVFQKSNNAHFPTAHISVNERYWSAGNQIGSIL